MAIPEARSCGRPRRRRAEFLGALAFLALAAGCGPVSDDPGPPNTDLLIRVMQAEDRRAHTAGDRQILFDGLASTDPAVRRTAVRAIGRLERAELLDRLREPLLDEDPAIRATAANAVGQAVYGQPGAVALEILARAGVSEEDPAVRGVIAQTIGRLRLTTPEDLARAESSLVSLGEDTDLRTLVGVARGLESLTRLNRERSLSDPAQARILSLAGLGRYDGEPVPALIRRLATAAGASAGLIGATLLSGAVEDSDWEVRRHAVRHVADLPGVVTARLILDAGLRDQMFQVRYQALQTFGLAFQEAGGCGPLLSALDDESPHVVLLAIDLLGNGCPATEQDRALAALEALAIRDVGTDAWHATAHALVAFARQAPMRARAPTARAAGHPLWWVRMWSARAAAAGGDDSLLAVLANDAHPNVREAAITALSSIGDVRDDVLVEALALDDFQLLRTVAGVMSRQTVGAPVATAAAETLGRISSRRVETSRDARLALLDAIDATSDQATTLLSLYLQDWDPVVARAAAVLVSGHGEAVDTTAIQSTLTAASVDAVPSFEELQDMTEELYELHLSEGGSFTIRLFPFEAPTGAGRFSRLSKEGYFDGLTFHRVVPNFVIQGGSPGANEYVGDGPFARDELTRRSHLRGTVGISTRGRDTGDGQIFINLVDNVRLDHNYTIIGEVIDGLGIVDAALAGATIDSVSVIRR